MKSHLGRLSENKKIAQAKSRAKEKKLYWGSQRVIRDFKGNTYTKEQALELLKLGLITINDKSLLGHLTDP